MELNGAQIPAGTAVMLEDLWEAQVWDGFLCAGAMLVEKEEGRSGSFTLGLIRELRWPQPACGLPLLHVIRQGGSPSWFALNLGRPGGC